MLEISPMIAALGGIFILSCLNLIVRLMLNDISEEYNKPHYGLCRYLRWVRFAAVLSLMVGSAGLWVLTFLSGYKAIFGG